MVFAALSEPSSGSLTPVPPANFTSSPRSTSPSSVTAQTPKQLISVPINQIRHTYHLTLLSGIGIGVIGLTILLLLVLILLIRKKSKELKNVDAPVDNSWDAFPPTQAHRCQEGSIKCLY